MNHDIDNKYFENVWRLKRLPYFRVDLGSSNGGITRSAFDKKRSKVDHILNLLFDSLSSWRENMSERTQA